jgi:hypothetical protein
MAGWTITDPSIWAERQKENIVDVPRAIKFAMFTRIVQRTPVDKGAHRQNWIVTLNSYDYNFDENKRKGGKVLSEGLSKIRSAKGDEKTVFQNNGPAIEKLEYGGYGPNSPSGKTINGFSKQAPRGMVGITMQEFGGIVDAEAGKAKK